MWHMVDCEIKEVGDGNEHCGLAEIEWNLGMRLTSINQHLERHYAQYGGAGSLHESAGSFQR